MKTRFLFLLALLMLSGAGVITEQAEAQPGRKWILLGTRKVDYKLDRDVLVLGAREGKFRKLQLKVQNGSLNMHKMVIEYRNGQRDEIELRHNFRKGSDTRIIDLEGHQRYIKAITFWYDTDNYSNKKAMLYVFGRR